MNRYLSEIGVKEKVCSVMTSIEDEDRKERFDDQRKKFGFDERETWSLDYTSAEWLYSHLKMYVEIGSKMVNLEYHKFKVPVLEEKKDIDPSQRIVDRYYDVVEKEMTQLEAINLILLYLEDFLLSEQRSLEASNDLFKIEQMAFEKVKCAFHIYAEILGAMWW